MEKEKEKVIHIALPKLRGLTYPPQMQTSEKHAHTHKHHPHTYTQTRTQSTCLFPLSSLLQSYDREDLDSELCEKFLCEERHFRHSRAHTHTHAPFPQTQNISLAVNTDTSHRKINK